MDYQLTRPGQGEPAYRGVLALAKRARSTVGFLTNEAFADRAAQGTLLTAVDDDGDVLGYLLYDLPRDEVRIVHLVVSDVHRGMGIAKALVDKVAQDHSRRRGMFLHCRRDFEADSLWPRLDFVAVGERPGRSFDGKLLTRWFRSFGQPDLFTVLHEDDARPVATIDSCVFFDMIGAGPSAVAQQLRADWLGEHVRLAVTKHLFNEIHRGADAAERRRQTSAADAFRLAPSATVGWRTIYEQLRDDHPQAPESDTDDLMHLAQSFAAQATWLISGDAQFARRYGATSARLGGPRLVGPAAFLREVDELARGDRYRPVELANTRVTRVEVTGSVLTGLADRFVNHAEGERIRDLRKTLELVAASPSAIRLETIDVDDSPRGLVCWTVNGGALEVLLVRGTTGRGETTIGRHLLGIARDDALTSGAEVVRIADPYPSGTVRRSFRDEGFAATTEGVVVAHVLRGRGSLADLRAKAVLLGSPLGPAADVFDQEGDDLAARAASIERWFAPYRVVGAGIPSFVVPIRPGWATDLIDAGLAEQQLLPRPWALGLRRELVYYRSPGSTGGLRAPARLLWYVSGKGPGGGTIRATSHLSEVIVDEHKRLFHRFRPLGVYGAAAVAACADPNGLAMALRFSSTFTFPQPISLDAYRELASGDPKSKAVVMQSIRAIGEHLFVQLIDKGGLGGA